MANIPIDPGPFIPNGFEVLQIEGRTDIQRVVLPRRARRHEEYAIATIAPMPPGQVHFANVRDVLEEFFQTIARVGVRDIQKCPFGQAYIQFAHMRNRDRLVNTSPHVFQDISISFAKHNEGVNWRRFEMNIECWIMLVGPPLDNWFTEDITAIVCKFGRLVAWENDASNKGRIIAKIRCAKLRDIPKSIQLTDGELAATGSWTFSIEVLHQQQLGDGPPAEDPVPANGVDPHALPVGVVHHPGPVIQNINMVIQDNLLEEEDNQLDNINNGQGNQINGFDELLNAIDAEDNVQNANAGDNFIEN
jgi:hypothetical protein